MSSWPYRFFTPASGPCISAGLAASTTDALAQILDSSRKLVAVAHAQDHAGAAGDKGRGYSEPDTISAAGDDGNLVLKSIRRAHIRSSTWWGGFFVSPVQ
jgi:hypothetical protein